MATIFENLQNDSQYKASTGLDQKEFDRLHEEFKRYYQPKAYNQIKKKGPLLSDSREALFFILFYYKSHPTLEVLGLSFGFSDTAAFGYVDYVKPYLKRALQGQSVLVRRVFEDQQAFEMAFAGVEDLFIDGSELIIQRAKDPKVQQADFSGKKTHTLIMLLICDKAGRIIYVGQLFCGSQVDFTLFKKELAQFDYAHKQVWVDLGFTGIKNYLPQEQVQIGHKKPKNKELAKEEKLHNQHVSKVRVVVEHAIGGMKRYFILRHENRIRLRNKISDAVEMCASLWNFKRGFSLDTA